MPTMFSISLRFADYDPSPGLEKIRVPLFAINSADDLINPPELQILEREIKRVPKGRAIVIPLGPDTVGAWDTYDREGVGAIPDRTVAAVGALTEGRARDRFTE